MTPPTLLLGRADLAAIVERLGAEIAADHPDGVVLIGVLKGALIFLADLARAIRGIDVAIDFMAISRFAPDSGRVRILKDVELDLTGRDVVVVEDMVDTGLTANYLLPPARRARARAGSTSARCSTGRCGGSSRSRSGTAARRSRTSSCSATGCTSPSCTAIWTRSTRPIGGWSRPIPAAYVGALYGDRRGA